MIALLEKYFINLHELLSLLLPLELGCTCGFIGFFSVLVLMIALSLLLLVVLIILKFKVVEFIKQHLVHSCLVLSLQSTYPELNLDECEVYILITNFTTH